MGCCWRRHGSEAAVRRADILSHDHLPDVIQLAAANLIKARWLAVCFLRGAAFWVAAGNEPSLIPQSRNAVDSNRIHNQIAK